MQRCLSWLCFFLLIIGVASIDRKDVNGDTYKMENTSGVAQGEQASENLLYFITATKEQMRKDAGGEKFSEVCFIPEGRTSCAPQYIIAGSMKSGTTSLQSYLLNHPQLLPLRSNAKINGKSILANKEIRFFNNNEKVFREASTKQKDLKDLMNQYYNVFQDMPPSKDTSQQLFSGDATPMYVCKNFVGKRAYYGLPEAKVIIMVRNPVDRAYSEYWFLKSLRSNLKPRPEEINPFMDKVRKEITKMQKKCDLDFVERNLTLENAVEFNRCVSISGSIKNSIYITQIMEWKEMYGDNLLIINSNEFYNNTPAVMDEISSFIGLQPFNWEPIVKKAYNIKNKQSDRGLVVQEQDFEKISSYPPLPLEYQLELETFFDPFNKALARYLSKPNFWPKTQS